MNEVVHEPTTYGQNARDNCGVHMHGDWFVGEQDAFGTVYKNGVAFWGGNEVQETSNGSWDDWIELPGTLFGGNQPLTVFGQSDFPNYGLETAMSPVFYLPGCPLLP
jgi:hypothetical protein